MITLTLAESGKPVLINAEWIAYAHEVEGRQHLRTLLKLGSPHMETLEVTESLADVREMIKRGPS
jgi:hypothetical protein